MNLAKSKKGDQTFNVLTFMFFRVGFLLVVFFFLVFLYKSYIVTTLDVSDLEAQVFMHSILNSKNGIILEDADIGRSYPEIIDLSRFNDQTMESMLQNSISYGKENRHIAAKFTLKDPDNKLMKEIVYNKEWYDRWHILAKTRVRGPGGAKETIKPFYVLIKDNNNLQEGILEISVAIPNS